MRVHYVGSVGARPPVLAESQLAFLRLRDPDLVGDAVFVGGAQGGALFVARGGSVGLEIAEADRREETQCGPVVVVSASGVCALGIEFGAATAAPVIHNEASCSCTLQRSTMSQRRRQILAGHHWSAESEQLGHDAHAVRTRCVPMLSAVLAQPRARGAYAEHNAPPAGGAGASGLSAPALRAVVLAQAAREPLQNVQVPLPVLRCGRHWRQRSRGRLHVVHRWPPGLHDLHDRALVPQLARRSGDDRAAHYSPLVPRDTFASGSRHDVA